MESGREATPPGVVAVGWWSFKMGWLSRIELHDGRVTVRKFLKRDSVPAYMVDRAIADGGVEIHLKNNDVLWCMPLTSSLVGDLFGNRTNIRCAIAVDEYTRKHRKETLKAGMERRVSVDLSLGLFACSYVFISGSYLALAVYVAP
ncbi:hypothetical protein [Nocardiopsis halophila]|uniref:hypothetical protein n=1 Tax=Nocardiopsis halophila TaxID=141692 RepID=UPI0012685CFA|nr:hypothetical protein [Nocardiopsis halophila]